MGSVASAAVLGGSVFQEADLGASAKVVSASSETIYKIKIDASSNTGEKVYVAFYNTASPTVGTTAPAMCLPCAAGATAEYTFPKGNLVFDVAVAVACVQEAAADGGPTAPSGTVAVTILF